MKQNLLRSQRLFCLKLLSLTAIFLSGCGKQDNKSTGSLTRVVLQTDWYPQPEHGGFYQALVEGYYEEEGLEVEILPGGPNTVSAEKVALGQVQFAMGKSNDLMNYVARGVPLVMVGALLQHDPQALLFHQENPINDFADLDGKRIMVGPGSAFIDLIRKKYQIDFDVIPLDYSIAQYLLDKTFIQQCYITSEPYFAKKEGANPGALLIKESGFDPYHVWYTRSDYALKNPEIMEAFSRASIKGWKEYLFGESSKADELLKSLNPKLDDDFIAYSKQAMIDYGLVTGESGDKQVIGTITRSRIENEISQLVDLGVLKESLDSGTILYSSERVKE